jgi:hypothetical protein
MNIRGGIMQIFLRFCFRVFFLFGLLVYFPSAAFAQDDEAAAIRQELDTLKSTVERLEERLLELEKRPVDASKPASSAPSEEAQTPPAAAAPHTAVSFPEGLSKTQERAIRDRWKKMKRGLTEQETESLLGKPKNVVKVDNQMVWYYRYEGVGSTVVFAQDGRVTGWQKPTFGLLW